MVGHGGSSAGSYLADPTSPIPTHCAPIVATSTLRVKLCKLCQAYVEHTNVDTGLINLYARISCMFECIVFQCMCVSSQIHLISPGCPRPNSALTVHKSGLKHRSSIHPSSARAMLWEQPTSCRWKTEQLRLSLRNNVRC